MLEKKSFLAFFLLIFVILIPPTLTAEWTEVENFGLGNTSIYNGVFLEIPDSPYVLISTGSNFLGSEYLGEDLMIIDKSTTRFRDSLSCDRRLRTPVVLKSGSAGWDIFFTTYEDSKFGFLHIDEKGEFHDPEKFQTMYEGQVDAVASFQRGEVYFVADKIYRYRNLEIQWTEFSYPEEWDSDYKYLNLFLSEAGNSLLIYSFGNNIQAHQLCVFDLENENSFMIEVPENIFFETVYDIQGWNDHYKKILLLKNDSLWSLDIDSKEIIALFLFDNYNSLKTKLMQSSSGNYVYIFGWAENVPATVLHVLDLEDKSDTPHFMPLEENSVFYGYPVLDRERQRIVTLIKNQATWRNKPCFISLDDFSLSYLPGIELRSVKDFLYCQNENVIFASGDSPFIQVANLDTGGVKTSIPLSYSPEDWSVVKGDDFPTLLSNQYGPDFFKLMLPKKRVLYRTDIIPQRIAHYPDGSGAVIIESKNFKEYFFDDESSYDLDLPFNISSSVSFFTDPDPSLNQIISFHTTFAQFIKPFNNVNYWQPFELETTTGAGSFYDEYNNSIWIIRKDKETGILKFYKLSTKMNEIIETFDISIESFKSLKCFVVDPLERYICLINEYVEDTYSREAVFINLSNKEIAKRFDLQINVEFNRYSPKIIPYLLPIPELDNLFIWGHYNAWCIDTNSFEQIYGQIQENPTACYVNDDSRVQAQWAMSNNHVIVFDNGTEYEPPYNSPYGLFEIDVETGDLVKRIDVSREITKVFFPENQNKVILLNPERFRLETLYLTTGWENPSTITPSTNYIQFGPGDNLEFRMRIQNDETERNVFAYIWLVTPEGNLQFITPYWITPEVKGVPLLLPANIDVDWTLLSLKVPDVILEGFYNLNAVLINENGQRGPIGTWNFYVRD